MINIFEHVKSKKYKNEEIMQQELVGNSVFIITLHNNIWSLYNHTENKKICTSQDWNVVNNKMKE